MAEGRYVCLEHAVAHSSKLFIGKDTETDQTVVIKRVAMNASSGQEGVPQKTLREISCLKDVSHPNIITLKDVTVAMTMRSPTHMFLIFEKMDFTLESHLQSLPPDEAPTPSFIQSCMRQLLTAVSHCHSKGIIHSDLNPRHILLSSDRKSLKLCGFGMNRQIWLPPSLTEMGTLSYRSPECLVDLQHPMKFNAAMDVWAAGCIFAELVSRQVLFKGTTEIEQLGNIIQVVGLPTGNLSPALSDFLQNLPPKNQISLDDITPTLSSEGRDLLKRMLDIDPANRIPAKAALKHPYFAATLA